MAEIPHSFLCSITHTVMTDPVVDPEGNTYERAAIEEWLSREGVSPMTRAPLAAGQLVSNRALRDAIVEWKHLNTSGGHPAAPAPAANTTVPAAAPPKEVHVQLRSCALPDPAEAGVQLVQLEALTPPATSRVPVHICCVVDVSGSMSIESKIQTSEGQESHGLSILDIVKHSVKVIIRLLNEQDQLSLVTYSNKATTVLTPIRMNDAGKARAVSAVGNMTAYGGTNLWDGLHTAMEIIRSTDQNGSVPSVMLLTDGVPNLNPPRGILPMLRKYLDATPLSASINTFGFGYNLDSELLEAIALRGQGMYSFIPDSGMVGTAFIHSLANALLQIGKAQVELELTPGVELLPNDALVAQSDDGRATVDLGMLQYGARRSVVLQARNCTSTPLASATLRYTTPTGNQSAQMETGEGVEEAVYPQARRMRFVECVHRLMDEVVSATIDLEQARVGLQSLHEQLVAMGADPTLISRDIAPGKLPRDPVLGDLDGQIKEAFSLDEWFNRWGKHYLRSLLLAHRMQLCTNFKDVGLQDYAASDEFERLRDEGDECFNRMEPPTPSITASPAQQDQSASAPRARAAAPINMAAYNQAGNPCFAGDCMVAMAGGMPDKAVESIRQGDKVLSSGQHAVVECVVKTICRAGTAELVELGHGLRVTPWHPVKDGGRWVFPAKLGQIQSQLCNAVYSFVLEGGHSMSIGGVECITLGHGIQNDPVASHQFFGTETVRDQLSLMPGWDKGFVEFESGCLIRDPESGLVCGFDHKRSIGDQEA